ncbi:MAG TPA: hypothetical protein VFV52_13780 [Bacilli bacterium]|nr:hypothetical protein [Bacilli bacterium]
MEPVIRMQQIPADLTVRLLSEKVSLSAAWQEKIDAHWERLLAEGKTYTRGECFTVSDVVFEGERVEVLLKQTDYAHYLYTLHHKGELPADVAIRVMYAAALVETADGRLVFGEMGQQTGHPGRLQAIGGGLDFHDVEGDRLDLRGSLLRELEEELGLDGTDAAVVKSVAPLYFKGGGDYDFLVVLYKVTLHLSAEAFLVRHRAFEREVRARGEQPELSELILLPKDPQAVEAFLREDSRWRVDYLAPFLRVEAGLGTVD